MKVLVGSRNPVKIEATKDAFSKFFDNIEVVGIEVDSKVSNQPINQETFEGAKNRVMELRKINKEKNLGAKFFVGIEGGIIKLYSRWFAFSAVCIMDEKGRIGFGTSPHFELPPSIVRHLLERVELGKVMDRITGDPQYQTKRRGNRIFYKKCYG